MGPVDKHRDGQPRVHKLREEQSPESIGSASAHWAGRRGRTDYLPPRLGYPRRGKRDVVAKGVHLGVFEAQSGLHVQFAEGDGIHGVASGDAFDCMKMFG